MSDAIRQDPTLADRVLRAGVALAMCGAGGLIGFALMPEPEAHAALPVPIAVGSERVTDGVGPAADAAGVAERYLGGSVELRGPGVSLRMRRADLGARVDLEHLRALLRDASDARSSLRRAHEALWAKRPLVLPMPAELDAERARAVLLQLKDQVDREPVDAHVDPRARKAVHEQAGVALDVYASLERLDRALQRGDDSVELALASTPARRSVERLQHVEMESVLGEFTTRYARGTDMRNRTHNLHVAASKLDGYVIEPGEVFDFNAIVGDRTAHNGFRMAPVIADGVLVEGMGGGTCQIASTLHAAALFAGLPILTRSPHSHPSFYIKLGLDATVVYGSQNLRFQNDRPFPLVIEATVEDGFVRAALHGKERTTTVTFLRRIDEITPFDEKIVKDPSLPRGMRILQQRGIPGFKITRFRVVRDDTTNSARRERSSDAYPPSAQIWRVGSGAAPAAEYVPPKNDGHPEYVADEMLIATQGPQTDGIEVKATPGKSGTFGWTEREHMMRPAKAAAAGGT